MPRILITRQLPGDAVARIKETFGEAEVDLWDSDEPIPREELLARARGKEAVLALLTERIDGEFLDAAGPQLKIVANMAVGYDNVDVAAAREHGVLITNTPGVLTETTADLAWALMLAAARRVGEAERYVRDGHWGTWSPSLLLGVDIYGKTLGIFGMGRIGQAVARRALGFNMRVIYHNRHRVELELEQELRAEYVSFGTLLTESDFLSVHCPMTDDTRHRFSAAEFEVMKPTAVFVNTARGPIVHEPSLAEALKERRIFAAGIDVFEDEPHVYPSLLQCEKAVLIPHLGSATQETRAAMANKATDNLIACLQGRTPPNIVEAAP